MWPARNRLGQLHYIMGYLLLEKGRSEFMGTQEVWRKTVATSLQSGIAQAPNQCCNLCTGVTVIYVSLGNVFPAHISLGIHVSLQTVSVIYVSHNDFWDFTGAHISLVARVPRT